MSKRAISSSELKEQFSSYFKLKFSKNSYHVEEQFGSIQDDYPNSILPAYLNLDDAIACQKEKTKNIIKQNIKKFDDQYSNIIFKFLIFFVKLGFFKGKKIHSIVKMNEELKQLLNEEVDTEIKFLPEAILVPENYPKVGIDYYYIDFDENKILAEGLKFITVQVCGSEIYYDSYNKSADMCFNFKDETDFSVYLGSDGVNSYNSKSFKVNTNRFIYTNLDDLKNDFKTICNNLKERYSTKLKTIESIINTTE